jgi:hypothetical protein
MKRVQRSDIVELLDCEIGARPKGAPGIEQLLPLVRGGRRTATNLQIELDPEAAEALEAFVEAERLCCAGIGWEIERDPALVLSITASESQLDAMEPILVSKANIERFR